MKYKALMLDVDGTIIPYALDALPTPRVKEALHRAINMGVHVCLVTGRSYPAAKRILFELDISKGYIVVDGGALVYDIQNPEPIHSQYLEKHDVDQIITLFEKENIPFFVKDKISIANRGDHFEIYKKGNSLIDVSMIFTRELFTLEKFNAFHEKLSSPKISLQRVHHKEPDKYGFNITHALATKMHGIEILLKELGLKREEIIGAGDGYNDFPLLMASGLKIAMGNAVDDLKEIADYVAPSVEDDGVADIIEKFVTMDK